MNELKELDVSFIPNEQYRADPEFDLDKTIFDLDGQIDLLSSQADKLDYSNI